VIYHPAEKQRSGNFRRADEEVEDAFPQQHGTIVTTGHYST